MTQIEAIKHRLAGNGERYISADDYYADKDLLRRLQAEAKGKHPREIDPMGFWFGMQSN